MSITYKTGRVALLLMMAVAVGACGNGSAEEEAGPAAEEAGIVSLSPADVAEAKIGNVQAGIVLTGSLEPAQIVKVNAQVPGVIANVRVDRGTAVRAGQPLATIQAEGVRGAAEGAVAGVAAAEANLALAAQRLDAAKTLREAGAMSAIDYRAAEAQHEAARAQVAAARAQAAGATEAAARATVTAPISGIIGQRDVENGEAVNPGQELFTVVQSDFLELAGQVPVDAAASIRPGQPVVFSLNAAPGRELRGEVARIEPTADPATRQVGVYTRLRNPGNIIGGQFASGRILTTQSDSAVSVPESAVRRDGLVTYVLAISGDRVQRKEVAVGPVNPSTGWIAIVSGLTAGETVITTPNAVIENNSRVRIVAPGATTGEERRQQ